MEIIMLAYQTMEEYHCLMMEAQIEFYLWEKDGSYDYNGEILEMEVK